MRTSPVARMLTGVLSGFGLKVRIFPCAMETVVARMIPSAGRSITRFSSVAVMTSGPKLPSLPESNCASDSPAKSRIASIETR